MQPRGRHCLDAAPKWHPAAVFSKRSGVQRRRQHCLDAGGCCTDAAGCGGGARRSYVPLRREGSCGERVGRFCWGQPTRLLQASVLVGVRVNGLYFFVYVFFVRSSKITSLSDPHHIGLLAFFVIIGSLQFVDPYRLPPQLYYSRTITDVICHRINPPRA